MSVSPAALAPLAASADVAGAPAPIRGCGWFDSSHELACGLAVIEHRGFEALPPGLPLPFQMAAFAAADRQRAGAW